VARDIRYAGQSAADGFTRAQTELGDLRAQSQLQAPRYCVRAARSARCVTAVPLASLTVPGDIIIPSWWCATLRPACVSTGDGLGLEVLQDRLVEGEWPGLLGGAAKRAAGMDVPPGECSGHSPPPWFLRWRA
jgi:hypothetical protein